MDELDKVAKMMKYRKTSGVIKIVIKYMKHIAPKAKNNCINTDLVPKEQFKSHVVA